MFKELIEKNLKRVIVELGYKSGDPDLIGGDIVLSIPENPQFGEYTSNSALQLAKQNLASIHHSSLEIANQIVEKFGKPDYLKEISVAGPGFINFFIKDEKLLELLESKVEKGKSKQRVLVEYASPNANKPFHIGHLRNLILGEAIARITGFNGDEVFRVTYTSDIGLTTAKALWGVLKLKDEYLGIKDKSLKEKAVFLGKAYIEGYNNYESNPEYKQEIDQINTKLYQKDSELMGIWMETRDWSEAYLDTIYLTFGTEFDALIWESEVAEEGKRIVEENIGKVFKKDQGAVIFPGEEFGLHTRVFINSQGNPTYEAKEVAVTFKEEGLFPFDKAVHVVGSEQTAYFQVVIKAIEELEEKMKGRKKHISYGMVNLSTGKMSSRKGNTIAADELLEIVEEKISQKYGQEATPFEKKKTELIAIAAIKFFMLKFSPTSDIAYDVEQSISLEGDTGPYVMYAYARAASLLSKSNSYQLSVNSSQLNLEDEERYILRYLEYFNYYTIKAAQNYQPNEITNYLLDLAKAFNLFYQKYPILKSEKEVFRLALVKKVGDVLKQGLGLLGIETVEKM